MNGLLRRILRELEKSGSFQREREFIQHGKTTVYEHSVQVASMSVWIADRIPFRINRRSLIRGALLHDYFLYDWHTGSRHFHGFTHPATACRNAEHDYSINDVEHDIISRHMFPLTLKPPRTLEGFIVCVADKICALKETFGRHASENGQTAEPPL